MPSKPPKNSDPANSLAHEGPVDFKNFTFAFPPGSDYEWLNGIAVTDGEFLRDDQDDYLWLRIVNEVRVDVDRDGVDEAVVQLLYNTGGTGQFSDLIAYDLVGNGATPIGSGGGGDRADGGIDRIYVKDGLLHVRKYADPQGACCAGAIQDQVMVLNKGIFQTEGQIQKWGLINLDPQEETRPVEIKFLEGTSKATLQGTAAGKLTSTFKARAGQQLSLVIEPHDESSAQVAATLSNRTGVLAQSEPDGTLHIELPADGVYQLTFEALDLSVGQAAWFNAEFELGP